MGENSKGDSANFSLDIPVEYDADSFVAGGEPAGISAAVAAAESGAEAYLAQNLPRFGGMGNFRARSGFHADGGRYKFSRGGLRIARQKMPDSEKSFSEGALDIKALKRAAFDDEIGRYAYPIDICRASRAASSKGAEENSTGSTNAQKARATESLTGFLRRRFFKPIRLRQGREHEPPRLTAAAVMSGCFIMGQAAGIRASMAAASKAQSMKSTRENCKNDYKIRRLPPEFYSVNPTLRARRGAHFSWRKRQTAQ